MTTPSWIEIEAPGTARRHELSDGLARIGGPGCEVVCDSAGADQVHLSSDPPRLRFVGKGELPMVDGQRTREATLRSGAEIHWLDFRGKFEQSAVLEEIPVEQVRDDPSSTAWRRIQAGLCAELGLVSRSTLSAWQQRVLNGEFDADRCAAEFLDAAGVGPDDPRLVERSGRLLRDFTMAPLQRGMHRARRGVRRAARNGFAMLIAQLVVVGIVAGLLLLGASLARYKWDWSADQLLDNLLSALPGR